MKDGSDGVLFWLAVTLLALSALAYFVYRLVTS